ncbi:MAG TPA: 2TM domain-containing protein [Actinomycetota bacterium]|nr:2TM domain-containing protein [Actinomycetota bacterium]
MASTLEERPRTEAPDDAYERARKRAAEVQGLVIHTIIFVVINAGLFVINLVTTGGDGPWWWYWAPVGWGIGLAIHALVVAVPVFSPGWVDRRARRMVERERRG